MRKDIKVEVKEKIIAQNTDVVYAQRKYWCDSTTKLLKLSISMPRSFFPHDPKQCCPLIVWLCGGGFTETDHNIWLPEMAYYAKHGFAVASVEYNVLCRNRWPSQLTDIKEAIRFLRANADYYGYNAEKIAIMGESAGGYLSIMVGLTNDMKEYDTGGNLDQSSAVQAVIPIYPGVEFETYELDDADIVLPKGINLFADPLKMIREEAPPFMIMHGYDDTQVNYNQSIKLYDALQAKNVESDLYLFKDCEHCDAPVYQSEIKNMVIEFLNKHII